MLSVMVTVGYTRDYKVKQRRSCAADMERHKKKKQNIKGANGGKEPGEEAESQSMLNITRSLLMMQHTLQRGAARLLGCLPVQPHQHLDMICGAQDASPTSEPSTTPSALSMLGNCNVFSSVHYSIFSPRHKEQLCSPSFTAEEA